jgi:plasmid stabilization system protein ParE
MKVLFTERAADEIEAIVEYLAARSPIGARNVQLAMQSTFSRLSEFPYLGRSQAHQGLRKIGVSRYPYNVYYVVDEAADEIAIVAVRHMSRAPEFYDA